MPEHFLHVGQALAHGVHVDAHARCRGLGVLVVVEVGQQRGGELRAAPPVVRQQRADGRVQEDVQARLIMRLEEHRVERHFVLPDDVAPDAQAPEHRERAPQGRVERRQFRRRLHGARQHAAIVRAQLLPCDGLEALGDVVPLGRAAHDGERAVDLAEHELGPGRGPSQPPHPGRGHRLVQLDHHEGDGMGEVQPEAVGAVLRQGRLVLPGRHQGAQQVGDVAGLARLDPFL